MAEEQNCGGWGLWRKAPFHTSTTASSESKEENKSGSNSLLGGRQQSPGPEDTVQGAAESPGARGLRRGPPWGFRLPTREGGEVWQHLFSSRAFPWATLAHSPPFPLALVTPAVPLGKGGQELCCGWEGALGSPWEMG